MARKKESRKLPPNRRVYQPSNVPDLFDRVEAACQTLGQSEGRVVSVSEFFVKSALERLERLTEGKGKK